MKKRIKKYLSGSMAVVLLSISVPLQITAEPDIENDSNVVGMEKEISPDTDKIPEDMMKEPTDTDRTMVDAQDNSNVSDWIPTQDTVSLSVTDIDDISNNQEEIDIVNESMNENARIDASDDTEDVTDAFTDPRFRQFVRSLLNITINEPITKSACADIESIHIEGNYGEEFKNLNGIEYFKNLKHLDCSGIDSLDVSGCTNLQTLKYFDILEINISGCPALEDLEFTALESWEYRGTDKLNISGCPALKSLECFDVDKLNINECSALESLECRYLGELNISGCSSLESLKCQHNGYSDIGKLNISKCDKLQLLTFVGYSEINLRDCISLQTLDLDRESIDKLNISGCSALESLECQSINELNISGCSAFKSLECLGIDKLNISECSVFGFLDYRTINELNISGCPALESLECRYLHKLNISKCNNLQSLAFVGDYIRDLDLRDCSNLQTLDIDPGRGMNHPNRIDTLEVSGLSNLQTLNCHYVDNINAGGCSGLKSLTCHYILNLDIKGCDSLESLDCSHGELEKLDIRNHPNLQSLKYNGGCSQTLDASGCINLQYLEYHADTDFYNIMRGDLKNLNVRNCTNLQVLDCNMINLENLDVRGCTNLQSLNCSKNILETLDVSDCVNLQSLNCEYNHLKTLDIRGNTSLQSLDCGFNGLESLNVSDCTNIQFLHCYGGRYESGILPIPYPYFSCYEWNKLKNLDIKGCTNLQSLHCNGNDLESLDLSGCDNLASLNCVQNIMKSPDDVKNRSPKLDGDNFKFYPQGGESNVTITPTEAPTQTPATEPTIIPTQTPIAEPTKVPTQTPTVVPTARPTIQPTAIPSTTEKKEQKMSVDRKSLTLYASGKATVLNVSNAKGKITYKSSNPKVVKVSKKGKVSPKSIGKATITIKSAGNNIYKAATLKVAVTVKGNFKKSMWIAYTNGGFYFKIHKVTGKKMRFSFHMPNMDFKNKTASIKSDGKTAIAKVKCPDGKVHALKIVISKNAIKVQETSSCTKKLLGSSMQNRKRIVSHKFRPDEYPWNVSDIAVDW